MKFVFTADRSLLKEFLDKAEEEITAAKAGAVQDAAAQMVREGRANIASTGFSARWQQGLRSRFYSNRGGDPAAVVFHRIGFAGVFETGAKISGKPLLWLPIRRNLPNDRIRRPKQYGRKFVSANVAGHPPMLFDAQDRRRGPLFFGVRSVKIRDRWDLRSIFERIMDRMQELFDKRMAKK